ncbi:MAG: hypothetical protein K2G61_01670, partial [Bacteroidaceae bacterium]|nr:hypothetical protein [Bacteroidaceae bacterium]
MYPKYADTDTTRMTQDAQLKVFVTGNDIQGNLYNSIAVQDENGDALIICINKGSLYGYLPVGQDLIIDTKGLYIGGYGGQPQIGVPYTNKGGSTFPSRMDEKKWEQHFRLLPTKTPVQTKAENEADPLPNAYVIPEYSATEMDRLDRLANCGKLMPLNDDTIKRADGTKTWASKADAGDYTSVQLSFNEIKGSNTMVYTSTYADFANTPIPTEKMNLTGIWKVYNGKWELVLRSEDDIKTAN